MIRIKRAFFIVFVGALIASSVSVRAEDIHVVSDEAPTLCEIGVLLYGKCGAFRELAEWSGIPAPYRVRAGQKLILRHPGMPREQGRGLLLAYWRAHFGLPKSVASVEIARPEEKQLPEDKPPPTFEALVEKSTQTEMARNPESPRAVELRKITDVQTAFAKAREDFSQKNYEAALSGAREIREQDSAFLPAWLLELAVFRSLKKEEEARAFASELLVKHPSASALPVLRPYLNEVATP
ncbi:MAG: hypothetical protein A2X94_15290 [Bdellovibrionales bacterium GWB1_55_8]|nr:MAG: hypothetical protein A2X94_15290 [Bdellovibrionales bacterium GWB1_55_8]